ncbi:MAG: IS607 family transposase [Calothrix sp. MO_167.B12]|nr:IS607 family transposase [Calothrix sp. MO_167.B12]
MHRLDDLLPIGEAAKIRGVSVDTIRRWQKKGKLRAELTEGGHRRFKVADLLKVDNPSLRFTVCYGRVSTRDKKDDLARQIAVLELYAEDKGWNERVVLKDIGSGVNYKKKGLFKLLEMLQRNEVERLIITDKDRLLRLGSELIFSLCEINGTEVIILNKAVQQEPEQEMVEDILAILTVFSARLYGKRSKRNLKAMQAMHEAAEKIIGADT